MRHSNLFIGFFIAIVVFFLGAYIGPALFQQRESKGILPIDMVSVADSSHNLFTIEGEYPQFPTLSEAFNASIQEEVEGRISEFKKNSEENWNAREATLPEGERMEVPEHPFFFGVTWETKQLNTNFVSFVLHFDSFEGGAHGRQELRTFNFDATKDENITLKNLFPGDDAYLSKVSEYAKQNLESQFKDVMGGSYIPDDMIQEGTKPTEENFSNFVFDNRVIVFYFQKYQVAPGAAGEQKVIMTRPRI